MSREAMKHTPGPWFQGTGNYEYCVYDKRVWINQDGSRGGETPNLVVVVSPEDAIADARLIAAAPDLLEALKDLLDEAEWLRREYSHDRERDGWDALEEDPCFTVARAAIAKATGDKS